MLLSYLRETTKQDLSRLTEDNISEALHLLSQAQQCMMEERENRTRCVICLDAKRSVVLLPCGHQVLCVACAEKLKNDECPLCRQAITSKVVPKG